MQPKHLISDVLDEVARRVDPIIQEHLSKTLDGLEWTVILTELDASKGFAPRSYSRTDVQVQLRMITEPLGKLRYPFDDNQRTVSTLGNELRIVRNDFAHGGDFDWIDGWRAGDFAVRLLSHLGDDGGADACRKLRDQAYAAMGSEAGIVAAAAVSKTTEEVVSENSAEETRANPSADATDPPDDVFETDPRHEPISGLGSQRQVFEPWKGVIAGPKSVIEQLPKKPAKMRLRAVATEIVDFEGPIEIERLARLVSAAFGWGRLTKKRLQQIEYQIKQIDGVVIDDYGYAWPEGLSANSWTEFRPQSGSSVRAFTQISPHEICNAARFIAKRAPALSAEDFAHAVIAVFGRSKITKQTTTHLEAALNLLSGG